jgi:hypothetical protein
MLGLRRDKPTAWTQTWTQNRRVSHHGIPNFVDCEDEPARKISRRRSNNRSLAERPTDFHHWGLARVLAKQEINVMRSRFYLRIDRFPRRVG